MKKYTFIGIGVVALVGVALAQTVTFNSVIEVRNEVSAIRLLECYRETPAAPVICNLQYTNTTGAAVQTLSLEAKNVVALATVGKEVKPFAAQTLKVGTQKNALSKIVTAVDPRASVALSATFTMPNTISSLNALRIGGFQLTDIKIGTTKPAQLLGTYTVLDPTAMNFNVDAYKFTFQKFSDYYIAGNSYVQIFYEVVNTGDTESKINLSGITARIINDAGTQVNTTSVSDSTGQGSGGVISAPKGVTFTVVINVFTPSSFYSTIAAKPAKYFELNIKGDIRTFQNIDLRPFAK